MSDSRLEKFIYAICSMEVSDLPAPLSRIETLWNCLITGETPDFEPLSRNEKYLMAMLDRYDISNLPAPMSRGEKLLYKIAVGETDLSDVPGYLSRYEELLKYLIENGGIGFEYVLYTLNQSLSTLYNTAEKPVKSAILLGQTLVNLIDYSKPRNEYILKDNDTLTVTSQNESTWFNSGYFLCGVTYGKTYRVMWDSLTYTHTDSHGIEQVIGVYSFDLYGNQVILDFIKNSNNYFDFTIPSNIQLDKISVRLHATTFTGEQGATTTVKGLKVLEYQEGIENWDIPYFEGMQSVKLPVLTTTGKNLFNLNEAYDDSEDNGISFSYKNTGVVLNGSRTDKTLTSTSRMLNINHLLKPGKTYSISSNYEGKIVCSFRLRKKDGSFDYKKTFEMNNQYSKADVYIQLTKNTTIDNFVNSEILIQFEESSSITPYEPFKSNILTVNEDVKLRGIGDVQDTLDLMTGEVTERIGEIVLDGSQKMVLNHTLDDVLGFYMESKIVGSSYLKYLMCDKLPVKSIYNVNEEGIRAIGGDSPFRLYFTISKSKLSSYDVDGLNNYLKQNPITVHYRLITESIKTVDLTTVDQDGQPTKLKTFNDITYVEIKADNLIPSVDLEVATKINEALSTMGPQQLDISNTQNKLGQTIDEQTENTDATMMATTEIYEQTL